MDQVHGIVRNVAGLAGTTELAITNSAVVRFPRREVLMPGQVRVRYRLLTIIHHGAALFPTVCYCTKTRGPPIEKSAGSAGKSCFYPLMGAPVGTPVTGSVSESADALKISLVG
jgi:hypothetical protein